MADLWPNVAKPVLGMLHVPPLPGAPRFNRNLPAIRWRVLTDAKALAEGGVHGLMIENFGDAPFFPLRTPTITATLMTALAWEIRQRYDLPLGVNVLRNDGQTALAVAHAVGAHFIRVNVLCGARVTDQGTIQGIAHDLLRERAALRAKVAIFADVNVKHSAPLAARPVADEVSDLIHRGMADGVIVSGAGTGQPTDLDELREVKAAAGSTPVFVGSGVTAENIGSLAPHADGFLVGTSLKCDGRLENPVDGARVRALVETARRYF